jgi:hypothetical protein
MSNTTTTMMTVPPNPSTLHESNNLVNNVLSGFSFLGGHIVWV